MKRNNAISIIKFLCPIFVIFAHVSPLTSKVEIISTISHYFGLHFVSFGMLAVSIIFLLSGYLFDSSLAKYTNIKEFWLKKLMRLLIPLTIIVLLSIVLGCIVSLKTLGEYISSIDTYKYLLNIAFIPQYKLPGVFISNPYSNVVNGSLWTMPLTILCYLTCFIINKFKLLQKIYPFITFLILVCLEISIIMKSCFFTSAFYPAASFYLGTCFSKYKHLIKYDKKTVFVFLLILTLSTIVNKTVYVYFIIFPYILFYIINKTNTNKELLIKDYSYEMYLCAFPIQQSLVYLSNNSMNQITHFILSTVLSIVAGVIIKNCSMLIMKRIDRNENICYRN